MCVHFVLTTRTTNKQKQKQKTKKPETQDPFLPSSHLSELRVVHARLGQRGPTEGVSATPAARGRSWGGPPRRRGPRPGPTAQQAADELRPAAEERLLADQVPGPEGRADDRSQASTAAAAELGWPGGVGTLLLPPVTSSCSSSSRSLQRTGEPID